MTAAAKVPAVAAPMLRAIPLNQLVASADNPRKSFPVSELEELGDSMAAIGQMEPLLVRFHPTQKGKFEIAAGESRWRAATRKAFSTLDCHIREMTDAQFYTVMAWNNLKRRNLKPMEEARAYQLLLKKSEGWAGDRWTVERIAHDGGVSVDYVRDRVRLLRLGASAMQLLEDKDIELGHAIELAKLNTTHQAAAIKDGLFTSLSAVQRSELLKLDAPPKRKAVTVHELKAWIDKHVLADPAHPDLPELFPETAKLLERGRAEKIPQVFIATGYVLPEVKRGVEVLTPANWRRADGLMGSKTCDRPKKIGIVAASDAARTQGFIICTSKVCPVHFPDQVRRAKQRAKAATKAVANGKPAPSAAEAERRRKDAEAKELAARQAKAEAIEKAMPAIEDAVLAAMAKVKPLTLLRMMIDDATDAGYGHGPGEKRLLAKLPMKDLESGLRRLFMLQVVQFDGSPFDDRGLEHELPDLCKRFGIDLKKIVAAAMPAPAAEQKPKATKVKPAKKPAKKKAKS